MRIDHFLKIILCFLLIISICFARKISINDESNSSSDEDEDYENAFDKTAFHQRAIFPSSTSQNREHLLNLLRKAYHDGWKPNIKHYIPATRFGRHN